MVETSVIVLTWNQKDLTIRCLDSLLKQKYSDYEVILVDNGSEDGTAEAVSERFGEKVKVVALSTNRGFCGGNNEGVRSSSKNSKYVMFLNNDTIVPDNLLSEAVKSIRSSVNIGAVSVSFFNKGHEKEFKKLTKEKISSTCNFFGDGVTFMLREDIDNNNNQVFAPCGTCFMYEKELVDLPFDEDYFIYAEENYFGMLLRLMGKDVVICKATSFFHENSAVKKKSSKKNKNYFIYLGRRNKLLNQLLFFEKKTLIKLFPLLMTYNFLETAGDFRNIFKRLKVYFYVISHFSEIKLKRSKIKRMRKINDALFLQNFSSKIYCEYHFKNILFRKTISFLNFLSYHYCNLVGIKTFESSLDIQKKYGFLYWRS